MIPANLDSISANIIREKGIEAVVDWFERHKHSFYTMGWFYLGNQRQMEELFYRSIVKVHKELPRYKNDTSFEKWVTSIFINNCRELSHDRDIKADSRQDLFKALDQLKDDEKEAMLLTYVKGFVQEEAAYILRVSVDKMKELLFSGILSVRKQLHGSTYNGCKEYHKNYIDYLEKSMDRPDKIRFEVHIYGCQECQEDLATFQDVTLMLNHAEWLNVLPIPDPFMENVKKRLTEKENHRQQKNKKRKRMAIAFASVFAFVIGIGIFTGAFTSVYYAWAEEDERLSAFLKRDLGQRVNLEAESNGVIIKIKGVVADDFQTLLFYEIEDTDEGNQYFMNYEDGLRVENENQIMSHETYPQFYPPDLKTKINNQEKNVFYGKVGLRPLEEDNGVIKLNITRIQELIPDDSESMGGFGFRTDGYKTGKWDFEVPVSKQPSIEFELNEQAEIEGIPIRFEKLIIAPTATILEYGSHIGQPEKRIEFVSLGDLEVNDKKVKTDRYGSGFSNSQFDMNWSSFQTHFDPLYGEKPKEVTVQLDSAYFTFQDSKSIELDVTRQYPQTFEYAGSTISIDKIEVGQPTTIVISNHEVTNRDYESLHLNIVGENENEPISTQMESESVLVDKHGVEYNLNTGNFDYEKIEQPRHFVTVQTIKLDGNKVIPKRLDIFGYNSLKYLDDVVKISLE